MDFDDGEYARRLERWDVTPLPAFRIEDWDGWWGVAAGGALIAISRQGRSVRQGRSITTSRTVWHRGEGRSDEVRVTSARPDGDDGARDSALTNMAIRIVGGRLEVGDDAEEHNREVFALADRLRAGEYPWTTATMVVDGTEVEFDVLIVGDVWAAFGDLDDDVRLDVQAEGVPFTPFRLTAFIPADDTEEDERWSHSAEWFLMRHGRWLPNFVHGWPTWFGNRKAGGLRGVPHDVAYLWSSLVERVTNRS